VEKVFWPERDRGLGTVLHKPLETGLGLR